MKRKKPFEIVTFWDARNPDGGEYYFKTGSGETINSDGLSSDIINAIIQHERAVLALTEDKSLVLKTKDGVEFYEVTTKDLKVSPFILDFFYNAESGWECVLEKKVQNSVEYNKSLFESLDGPKLIDQDCPQCGHLLSEPRDEEDLKIITCSSDSCNYQDDEGVDYSKNLNKYEEDVFQYRSAGLTEITGDSFQVACREIEESTLENKKCDGCKKGKIEVTNVFAKREHTHVLFRYYKKCNRCHRTSFVFHMRKDVNGLGSLLSSF